MTATDRPAADIPAVHLASAVDALADAYVDELCALDPITATSIGVPGHEDRLTDYSPAGHAGRIALTRRTLAALDAAEPVDDVDRVTVAAMRERLGLVLELEDAGQLEASLNVIASPLQDLRAVFDLMPTGTDQDWEVLARRLRAVPEAVDRYVQALRAGVTDGRVAARRQVLAGAAQCEEFSGDGGFFADLAAQRQRDDGTGPGDSTGPAAAGELREAARAAADAYAALGTTLREELAVQAPEQDAVGRETYALWSRYFLGARVDLDETYAWGAAELARIETEMARVADQIVPGGSVDDAVAALDADLERKIQGPQAFAAWMQELSDRAVAELGGTHFDIPQPVRRLDCRIAPTHTGGVYYTGPSEDFSRPGTMWWSVPSGEDEFSTWREVTTVYHEGVPGHHLQVGQTVYRSELLNRWRRLVCWTSGHGEGWALYAERLMADLGYLDDPADRLGMLDGSALRAARVVVDIGLHCGLEAPEEVGGGSWDAEKVSTFMRAHTRISEGTLRFEVNRYLGWPGQAPSYKVGERLWLQAREQVRAAQGDDFDLKAFHRRALDIGSVGLDVLREALVH